MRRLIENIRVAFQSLNASKLRAFLTMLGIIIGVGAVIIVMAVGAGAQQSIVSNLESMGTNLVTITPGRGTNQFRPAGGGGFGGPMGGDEETQTARGDLYVADYKTIKENATTISGVAPIISRGSTVSYMGATDSLSITASTEDIFSLRNYELDQGNLFSSGDVSNASNVAVIGSQVVSDYFGKTDPIGEMMKIDGKNFTVIGTLQEKGTIEEDDVVFVPITTAQIKLYGVRTVNNIVVKSQSKDTVDQTITEVTTILQQQHEIETGALNDFSIRSQTQMLETVSTMTNTLTYALAGIAAISLLVGGIGIMNIMFVSVTERTREIGIRKSIGAKNKDILTQFLTESVVLSVVGGILGILFAIVISYLVQKFAGISTAITASPIILSVCFSTVIGIIFGIFPAMRAARLNPIESLRFE
jgi:putative ABC transport system permease protein